MATYTLSRKIVTEQPEERLFSDQQTAKKYEGDMIQIIAHILKLTYKFNYERDHDKHISDISGWANKIIDTIKRDKSSKGASKVIMRFMSANGDEKLIKMIGKDFAQYYNYQKAITSDEFWDAEDHLEKILNCNNKEEVVAYLNKIFPKE